MTKTTLLFSALFVSLPSAWSAVGPGEILTTPLKEDPTPAPLTSKQKATLGTLQARMSQFVECAVKPEEAELIKPAFPTDGNPCEGYDREIVVLASTSTMYLCKNSATESAFKSAFGKNGFGKTADGDAKTPVGTYWLDVPRVSNGFVFNDFGIFIRLGYPTRDQKAHGYTGHSIGIHGPSRAWPCATKYNVSNWTKGCLAVPDDPSIVSVANWVTENWPVKIHVFNDR